MTIYLIEYVARGSNAYDSQGEVIGATIHEDKALEYVNKHNLRLAEAKLVSMTQDLGTGMTMLGYRKQEWQQDVDKKLRKWQPSKRNKGIPPEFTMPTDLEFAEEAKDWEYLYSSIELDELPANPFP